MVASRESVRLLRGESRMCRRLDLPPVSVVWVRSTAYCYMFRWLVCDVATAAKES